jgi:autotransporter-associated beta strand protein
MTKFGAGTLTLTADNSYTNGTVIAAGTLQLGNGGTTGTVGSSILNDSGKLVFNRSNLLTFGAQIFGAGSVTQLGTGTTVLTGDNTYNGGTTITAGTLQLGNGGTTGSILGNVANNGTLAFNRSKGYQFNGVISGGGAVQQNGAGTTTLTAVNTYGGGTTISAGTLALSGSGSIASSSGLIDNGAFDISGTAAGTSIKNLSGTGSVGLGSQTLTLTNASGTFAGGIGGNGGLVKQGAGLFTLSGTNTYSGATAVAGGELRVNGSVASAVNVQSGATLSGIGTVGGLVTVQSGGTLSAGQSPGTLTLGALNLNAGSTSVFELGSPGVVGGTSNDLVNVNGNLTLGGTLSVNAPSAGYYRLFNYGTMTASSFGTINGSSHGTPTVLTNVPNQVNLLIAAAGQRIQFWDGADQTGNGVVNGGTGTWNAANTNWTGAPGQAGINDQWRSSVGVFAGTAGTVTIAGAQAFDTLQFSTTGYVLNAGAGGQLQLAALSGTGTINTDNGVVATIGAPIVNGSSQSLTKVGGGTLILTGANTYSGGTTISGGTLQLGNGGTTGSILGNVTDNGVLAINRSDTVTFASTISGSGAFHQLGTGTTILTADNNYTGGTTISAGTLQLGNGGTTGSIVGNVLNDGRLTYNRNNIFDFGGAISGSGSLQVFGGFLGLTGTNTFSGGTTIVSGVLAIGSLSSGGLNGGTAGSLSGNVDVGGASGNTLNQLWFTRTDNTTFAGDITGSGLVAKFGPGVLTLTGTNVVGGTVIWDGVLQIGNGGTSGSLGGGVSFLGTTSTLRFNRSDTLLFGDFIGSGGFIEQAGSGTTILTGTVLGSPITISAGTLQVGNGGTTGSLGTGAVTNNSILAFNRSDALTVANAISGTGALRQIGSGTTILTGNNNYSGGTTISAGTLQLGSGGTTGSITGNVTDNATLAFNHSNAVTFAGVISGSGALNQMGGGTTTLTAANTYTGATMVTAGTLTIVATGSITSNVTNNATFNNAGVIFGSVGNVLGNLNNSGTITESVGNNATFNNSGTVGTTVNNFKTFNNNAGGVVTGLLDNAAGTTTNAGTLSGGARVDGGNLINNNLISGRVDISLGGQVDNNLTISGSVSNSAAFNNNAGGTVSGLLINSALLTPGTTTNTGHLNGGASVTGGTLNTSGTILGGLTNAATVNASGGAINGAIANNAGGTFNILGTVTSDNIFTNAAAATLAIGASGAYTLQGMLANSGVVTVASGGQLIATVGGITNNAGGTITVALGGTVKDDLNNAGAVANSGAYVANVATNTGAGSISNAATGTWTGNVLSNAAAIANNGGWTGNVVSNTGTIDNNKTWAGTVSNAGTFNNNAGATLSGLLTNTAGTTTNNGALNGGANVSGGMFTGSGSVTNLTVSGGVFAPGNGTPGSSMTISGNLAFQSGALYLVGLNPASSTFANVTGTAALNGGAGAAFLAGNYVAKQYTILTAAGGVSGTFGSFDTLGIPSGFRASLSYDAKDVFLNLEVALAKYSGLNVNQQNVANTLTNFFNATGGIPAVFGTLTPGGLTQVSGELATGSQQTTFDAMNLFLGLLTDPFVAGRGVGVTAGASPSQFAEESDASAYAASGRPRSKSERDAYAAIYRKAPLREVYDPRWSVWAAGYGGSQTTDGNAALGSNNTRSSIGGVAVGADYLFSPRTIAGFAVAGGGTSFSVNGSGSGRSDLFQAGAFVRHTNGPAYISAALAYGWQDVTTDRTVTVAGADLLRARFNANAWSGRVEGGYRFVTPWMAVGLTPYAAGQFTTFDLPAYAEQAIAGVNTFALNYAAKDVTASRSELGLRSDKSFAMQNGIFTLRGRAAWAHNFNTDRNVGATFQTLPGASFVVNGAAQAPDSALATASAEMKWLNGFSLAATFEGEFSNVTRSYAGKGVARYSW